MRRFLGGIFNMAKCSNCGAELSDYYEYCLKCYAYNPLNRVKICPHCNIKNLENAVYCQNCGNLLTMPKTTTSAKEGASISNNKRFLVCDKCKGYSELKSGETLADYVEKCNCGGIIELTSTQGTGKPRFFPKKKTKSQYKQKSRDKNSSKGLIAVIILLILFIVLIIDYRWIIGLLVIGFFLALGLGMEDKKKTIPSEKQKRHKTKNWAKRKMRRRLSRKL